jgi:hypothetical protein
MTGQVVRAVPGRRLGLFVVACGLLLGFGGVTRAVVSARQAQAQPFSEWTDAQKEQFLKAARIVKMSYIGVGITGAKRATLDDGRTRHDAEVQTVNEFKPGVTDIPGQRPQMNFHDSYKFNIAGYRLDRLIHLNMVPVSVYRVVNQDEAAVTWWVDDVQMMEQERYAKHIAPPDVSSWNDQMYTGRVFTELIHNTDPNLGNFLITSDWRLHMIDFTRAFRPQRTLREPKNLGPRLDRRVYAGLRELTLERLTGVMKDLLEKDEIEGLLARRDLILKHFDELIAQRGEAAVLYDEPGRR